MYCGLHALVYCGLHARSCFDPYAHEHCDSHGHVRCVLHIHERCDRVHDALFLCRGRRNGLHAGGFHEPRGSYRLRLQNGLNGGNFRGLPRHRGLLYEVDAESPDADAQHSFRAVHARARSDLFE